MKTLCSRIVIVSMIALNFTFSTTQAQLEFGPQQVISTNANGARTVCSADLDGDGDMDVISGSPHDDKIAWYENDSNGNFGPENVITLIADAVNSVHCADLDGDSDMDLVSASLSDNKVAWYENDGIGNFGDQNVITLNALWAISAYTADLDGDGDLDVLSASSADDKIAWYENDGSGNFSEQILISIDAHHTMSVYSEDLDGDGDMDVLSNSAIDETIAWYENDGSGNFSGQNVISSNIPNALSVYSQDLDGDGDMDVLSGSSVNSSSSTISIVWFENDGIGNFSDAHIIASNAGPTLTVYCQDLDGDGDMDVLASHALNLLTCYENYGNGNFGEMNVINIEVNQVWSVYCEDVDGDGDLDVLTASEMDDKIAWYENLFGDGCTDPQACNFDSEAFINNGTCCYGICGCTDPQSANYNSEAECDNGTCMYRVDGYVFFDENENGVWDTNEYGLPNQQVILHPQEWTSLTNDEGMFAFVGPGLGQYTIELIPEVVFPFVTTENPASVEIIWDTPTEEVLFGVSNEQPIFGICVDLYPSGQGYPCNDWSNHNICFRNEGNVPIDGIVEVEFDPLFQNYQEVTPIDSVVGNHIYMSFENLLPGQMFFYVVELLTPTVDYIGEFITSTARVYGYYEGAMVSYGQKTLTVEMTCSYDPNDMQVFPNGYEEPHFIWNNIELEYLIRFQNTGNASATNVLVTDTIDENLDLSTFMLMANSHSVITTIRPDDRVIEFLFQNIMLPDSGANEPESHGMISYKIKPYTNLAPGTVLHNTGNIYFDNNPPIITNTTWNTIYQCSQQLAALDNTDDLSLCLGETIVLSNSQDYIESWNWTLDGETLNGDSVLEVFTNIAGQHQVILQVSNPLCEASSSFNFFVDGSCTFNTCMGDFSGDGLINTNDLILLVGSYACQINCQFDLTYDDEVDMEDFLYFIGQYGNICP